MTTKLYGKDLKDYDDVDIETLLTKLSAEELEELNNDVDPDVSSTVFWFEKSLQFGHSSALSTFLYV